MLSLKEWIGTTEFRIEEPTVVSIGKFDGEHKGHQKIMKRMKKIAEQEGLATAVFTFGTPPSAVVGGAAKEQINTNEERREKLKEAGIDYIVEYPFTPEIASMSGEDFVLDVLIAKMHMQAIVAGPDCAFGKNRSGNAALLEAMGPQFGFRTCIIKKEQDGGRDISSTYIREELRNGNIEKANSLLGREWSLEGAVTRGNRIGGSRLGFPTVNLDVPEGKLMPRHGVYGTTVELEDGRSFRGITNIGGNPTVQNDALQHKVRIETFLLDFDGDLYGQKIRIKFHCFLRPEIKFESLEELKEQIRKDISAMDRKEVCGGAERS